jgi:hypothetical protein
MISGQFSGSINHKQTNLIQGSLAQNSDQFPQSRSIQSSDLLLESVFLHRSSACSQSIMRWWTIADQPSDVCGETARLHSVQFDGSITAFKTPIFRHSLAFRSVPLLRSDLLCQSVAFINSAILDRSLSLSDSVVLLHSSRFARTNHFLITDPLRFVCSPAFAESFRFQSSHEIAQSALLTSSPIRRRTNCWFPSSIVPETHALGNSASFVVSFTPIHSALLWISNHFPISALFAISRELCQSPSILDSIPTQLSQIVSLSVRLIASSILPDLLHFASTTELPVTSPFESTKMMACIKFVISEPHFSPRFVASRDPQATLLLNSDVWFDSGGFIHYTTVSEAQAAEGQERKGGSTTAAVWIGIIAALAILLLLIVFLIVAWRHGQAKTDEIDVAYDIETEFKEETVEEPETTLDDNSFDLDFANSLARRSDVDLDPDEFGTGGDESVFPF